MKWLFGVVLPYIGPRTLPMNRDGTLYDSGERDLLDERAPYYVRLWVVEWLGIGIPLRSRVLLRDARTGEPVEPLQA